jgi:glycosyltransferase involved in cell wall biosynthesis
MCVHNGHCELRESVESVLNQSGVELELVAVDDGSTDGSLRVLEEYAARDNRLRVLSREHRGLTEALISGCAEADGEYIARQDAGDISLPGRFIKQLARLSADSNLSLVSCGTRFFGPDGEFLYEVQESSREADRALRTSEPTQLHGPSCHGSTMFRKEHYLRAGGYRPQFKVAQDLDLWTRLADLGEHEVIQEVLYETSFGPGTISTDKRAQQVAAKKIIADCIRARASLGDDGKQLEQAARLFEDSVLPSRRKTDADFYYFLAGCLRRQDPERSKHYLMAALKKNPLHLKALLRAVQTQFGTY